MKASYPSLVVLVVLTLLFYADNVLVEMEVHFIDVEQGGAVLVQKNNINVLYDCGDVKAGSIVTDYLGASTSPELIS
jgi:beta-lactamase superfamily II metal-dependent hydrolase